MESILYIADFDGNRILAVNREQMAVAAEIPVGIHPISAVEDPLRKRLYVLNVGSHNISIIDMEKNEVQNSVEIESGANSMTLSADGLELILFHQAGFLSVMDTQQFSPIGRIEWMEKPKEHLEGRVNPDEIASPAQALPNPVGNNNVPGHLDHPFQPEGDLLHSDEQGIGDPTLPFPDLNMQPLNMPEFADPKGQLPFPMMPPFPLPNIPGSLFSGGTPMLNPFSSLEQTSPDFIPPPLNQFPQFEPPLQAQRAPNSVYIRSGVLNRLKLRIRNLGLPPKTVRMLERNLDTAMKHIRLFVSHLRKLVRINLLSEKKAAPIIKEAQKIISMTSVSRKKEVGLRLEQG